MQQIRDRSCCFASFTALLAEEFNSGWSDRHRKEPRGAVDGKPRLNGFQSPRACFEKPLLALMDFSPSDSSQERVQWEEVNDSFQTSDGFPRRTPARIHSLRLSSSRPGVMRSFCWGPQRRPGGTPQHIGRLFTAFIPPGCSWITMNPSQCYMRSLPTQRVRCLSAEPPGAHNAFIITSWPQEGPGNSLEWPVMKHI